jgi:hypothetical protein
MELPVTRAGNASLSQSLADFTKGEADVLRSKWQKKSWIR